MSLLTTVLFYLTLPLLFPALEELQNKRKKEYTFFFVHTNFSVEIQLAHPSLVGCFPRVTTSSSGASVCLLSKSCCPKDRVDKLKAQGRDGETESSSSFLLHLCQHFCCVCLHTLSFLSLDCRCRCGSLWCSQRHSTFVDDWPLLSITRKTSKFVFLGSFYPHTYSSAEYCCEVADCCCCCPRASQ